MSQKIVNAWYITCIVIVAVFAAAMISWVVKAIWFSPETEYINCKAYAYADNVVICQERPVESPVSLMSM